MNARTFIRLLCAGLVAIAVGATQVCLAQTQTPTPTQPKWSRVNVDLPVSDAIFPAGDGATTANAYCLMCHSEGMVMRQPPMTQAQWLAEVRKMRAFWGAPIPADQDEALAGYLARVNGPAAGNPNPTRR